MSAIFEKARAAADALEASGHAVTFSAHPTSYGNSAYVTARKSNGSVWVEKGFRLSDHGTGDKRKCTDEHPTVIDCETVSIDNLVALSTVSAANIEKAAETAAEQKAATIEKALALWATAPGKVRRRFKSEGSNDEERAIALLNRGTKW